MAQESWKVDAADETGCQPPEGPVPCANKCGFFGSAATMNLCSKCYRDAFLKHKHSSKAAPSLAGQNEQPVGTMERDKQHETQISIASSSSPAPKSTPNRCLTCKKRVGLTGFRCRCGGLFCSLHRYSEKHNCQFDYRTSAREAIAKANPVIKADKMEKI